MPGAADDARIRALVEEMARAEDLSAGASRVIEEMASGRRARKTVERSVLAGEPLMWPGGLGRFRLAGSALQVENPWYPGDQYHPGEHPRLPRAWEPVEVSQGAYLYAYAHYMDTANEPTVRICALSAEKRSFFIGTVPTQASPLRELVPPSAP